MTGRVNDLLTGTGDLDAGFRDELNNNFKALDLALDTEQQARAGSDSNLQAQITTEQQARLAQVQAHLAQLAAHAAAAITLSPVTGLTASNLQAAVEQLRTMLTTIIAGPAPSAAEIQAARVGADGIARASLDILIKEIHAKLVSANNQTANLKHGLNVVTADEAGPVALTIKGNTLVNLLGKDGNFEVDSNSDGVADGWVKGADLNAASIQTTTPFLGTRYQRITDDTGGVNASIIHPIQLTSGKYYLVTAMVRVYSNATSGVSLRLTANGVQVAASTQVTHTGDTWTLTYFKRTSDGSENALCCSISGFYGTAINGDFDAVAIYEVDATTYSKIDIDPEYTGAKIAERYPYVDGVKHVTNPIVTKIGKNLLGPIPNAIGPDTVLNAPYELTISAAVAFRISGYTSIPCIAGQTYSFCITKTDSVGYAEVQFMDAAGNAVSGGINGWSNGLPGYKQGSSIAPAGATEIRFRIVNNAAGNCVFTNWMLVLGSASALPQLIETRNDDYLYSLVILAGTDAVQDVLTVRGAEATVLRRWKTDAVLDGSYDWRFASSFSGAKTIYFLTSSLPAVMLQSKKSVLVKYNGMPLPYNIAAVGDSYHHETSGGTNVYLRPLNVDSGWGDDYTPSNSEIKAWAYGWKMNNGTFGTPYNGTGTKTWTRWDATSNTGVVTTVPTTLATGYTPYVLSYQLATPITEVVQVEGSLANHPGTNLYEVSEGVVIREKVVPKFNVNVYYIITGSADVYWGDSRTKRPASRMLAVYRNNIIDPRWMPVTGAVNTATAPSNFDPIAEYTVTYLALDKYAMTAPLMDTSAEYATSSKMVQDQLVQRVADVEMVSTINVNAIAELYRRMKTLGG